MPAQQSRGVCRLCGETFSKGGMSNYLRACIERDASASTTRGVQATNRLLRLAIQDRYAGAYWLHLEMPDSATPGLLDNYLRAIWLECCGHLSEFFFNETRYISYEDDDDLTFGPFAPYLAT